jgi:LPXTG-motif cell wall-anchored protein
MRRMTGARAVLMLVVGMLGMLFAVAGPAAAAPTPTSIPLPCPSPYPFENCQAHILSSTTTPFQGQTIEVSGLTYHANEAVTLTIGGIFVGTAHTDSNGNFDPPAVVPVTLLGDQPLTGRGASGAANDVDSLVLHITAAGTSNTGGGGLPNTGVKIAAFGLLAIALLSGGVLFTIAGRRRRNNAHSA